MCEGLLYQFNRRMKPYNENAQVAGEQMQK